MQALKGRWCVPRKTLPSLVQAMLSIVLNKRAAARARIGAFKALQTVDKDANAAIRTAIFAESHQDLVDRLNKLEAQNAEYRKQNSSS